MKKSENRSKTSNNPRASEGFVVILSAPSGCGKTTIVNRLLKRHPDWVRSVSVTTRPPRPGEKSGRDYFFVSERAFKQMKAKGELLESTTVFGHSYGTPVIFVKDQLETEKTVLLAIDVQGTQGVRKWAEKEKILLITFFVLPPSVKVLRERLEGRHTESPEEVARRIEVAQEEIKAARLYEHTVVNQNLDQTVMDIEEGIESFQKKRRPKRHVVHST